MRVRLTGGDRGTINKAPPSDGTALILNDDLVPGFMLRVTKRARTALRRRIDVVLGRLIAVGVAEAHDLERTIQAEQGSRR